MYRNPLGTCPDARQFEQRQVLTCQYQIAFKGMCRVKILLFCKAARPTEQTIGRTNHQTPNIKPLPDLADVKRTQSLLGGADLEGHHILGGGCCCSYTPRPRLACYMPTENPFLRNVPKFSSKISKPISRPQPLTPATPNRSGSSTWHSSGELHLQQQE